MHTFTSYSLIYTLRKKAYILIVSYSNMRYSSGRTNAISDHVDDDGLESIETEFDNYAITTTRFTREGSVKSVTGHSISNAVPVAAPRTQDDTRPQNGSCTAPAVKTTHDVSIGPAGIKTQDAATGAGCTAGICLTNKRQERLLDTSSRSPDEMTEQKSLDQLLVPVLTKALLQGQFFAYIII